MLSELHTRRRFLGLSGLSALSVVLAACGGDAAPAAEVAVETPEEALERLLEGNARYVADKNQPLNEGKDRREKLTKRQRPFATIFSCVDSRVPPELVFDRGLGDLFVIRTAGQVVDTAVLGSLEYGVAELEIPLILVMGHSACGAVKATVAAISTGEKPEAEIGYLVDGIAPAVTKAKEKLKPKATTSTKKKKATTTTTSAAAEGEGESPTTTVAAAEADPNAELVTATIEANVELVVERLKAIPILAEQIKKERLLVAGGVYDLESGGITITVGMPEELQKKIDEEKAKAAGGEGEGGATTVAGEGGAEGATTTAAAEH